MDYIINDNTIAIIGIDSYCSKVIEEEKEFIIDNGCHKIIDNSCLYYGSSYQGRLDSSKSILNRDYKLPIIVGNSNFFVFIPLKSTFSSDCIWINFNKIINYELINDKISVNFFNYGILDFDISLKSFESQIAKSCLLEKNMIFRLKKC